jgi:hypothetical protein
VNLQSVFIATDVGCLFSLCLRNAFVDTTTPNVLSFFY